MLPEGAAEIKRNEESKRSACMLSYWKSSEAKQRGDREEEDGKECKEEVRSKEEAHL